MPFISHGKLTWQYVPWEALWKGHFEVYPTSLETLRDFSLRLHCLPITEGRMKAASIFGPILADMWWSLIETCCQLMASFMKLPVFCFQLGKWSVFVAIYVGKLIMFCRHHLSNLLLWIEVVPKAGCGKLASNLCLPLSSAWWLGLIFSFSDKVFGSQLRLVDQPRLCSEMAGAVRCEGGGPGSLICMSKTMPDLGLALWAAWQRMEMQMQGKATGQNEPLGTRPPYSSPL